LALQIQYSNSLTEAGCDEAGRGCLAGPVVAAAVILPQNFFHPLLNDSKKVSKKNRDLLETYIKENAIAWAIGICGPAEIDKINILNASILAMQKALDNLTTAPQFILVDGNRFKKYKNIEHACMVKGDARFANIAAASILAKTHRDNLMDNLHNQYPHYAWNKNAGYPTLEHRNGIRLCGITEQHRRSFRLLPEQMQLF
jgi:ribonuclease HII